MGDYYQHYLSTMSVVGANQLSASHDLPPTMTIAPFPLGHAALQNPYSGLGYFAAVPDQAGYGTPKPRVRRKPSIPGAEHVKHRRTRSGCYTCRARRVKCDEARPVCERCRKGKRDCNYPEPPPPKSNASYEASSKDGRSATLLATSPSTSNDDHEDADVDIKLESIPDFDDGEGGQGEEGTMDEEYTTGLHIQQQQQNQQQHQHQHQHQQQQQHQHQQHHQQRHPHQQQQQQLQLEHQLQHQQQQQAWSEPSTSSPNPSGYDFGRNSETPPNDDTKSSSSPAPSIATSTATSSSRATKRHTSELRAEWAHLPPDYGQHLDWYCDNMTNFHYCMSSDVDDFFRLMLPSFAVRDETLLNAVVGFIAYNATLQDPNGKIQDFLKYFDRAVRLLIDQFQRKEKPNVMTLLTILQLATIEEYLGDWVNLLGHIQAAYEILIDLYSPQTIMQNPLGRVIILWYIRFDAFTALMGGFAPAIPIEWLDVMVDFYQAQTQNRPEELRWKYALVSARLRHISMDMARLINRANRGETDPADFSAEHDRITALLTDWKSDMDPALTNPAHLVTDLATSSRSPPDPDDVVDPFASGLLYDFPIHHTTEMLVEWHSVVIMHLCQSTTMPPARLYAELGQHSYMLCQLFRTLELWEGSPRGALINCQAALSISSLFMPHDDKHHWWFRRRFALMEMMGYMAPLSIREKMAALFRDMSCVRWWLPDDEGFSKILQSVRTFADERNAVAKTAQAENLREIRHIFTKLEVSAADDMEQLTDLMSKGKGKGKGKGTGTGAGADGGLVGGALTGNNGNGNGQKAGQARRGGGGLEAADSRGR